MTPATPEEDRMATLVPSYPHETGEHCASTALRNLLAHRGTRLSEGMVFGLASGLGFFYFENDQTSPSRMFHGRTGTLESDFGRNTGVDFVDREEPDDARAWQLLRERLDAGEPVMLSTDTYYLRYHNTTSHFPGHRCVAVGYDDDTETVLIADRKFAEYQRCSYAELRQSRNALDYAMSCENRWGDFGTEAGLGRPLEEAIQVALERTARQFLDPDPGLPAGLPAMRALAAAFPSWSDAADWSWAARFGYQVIIKRGAGGSFFRSLYADFLEEAAPRVPRVASANLPERMSEIAGRWRELAACLEEQSERETCDPSLFDRASRLTSDLADREQRFFEECLTLLS